MKIIPSGMLLFASLLTALCSCEKNDSFAGDIPSFPVGRSFLNTSSVDIKINGAAQAGNFTFDSCGGYWLHMHQSDLTRNDELKVTFTRKIHDTLLFGELSGNRAEWLTPSYFIDSENSEISEKAEELTKDVNARLDKAKRIQNYIAYNIRYEIYHNASLDKASKIYKPGYGICMNTSRLYVAKCRVVGIPARTVWGIIDDGLYDSHHQWAEMLDENGFWYHTDFGYSKNFELNDVRYLDLLYAAEENDIFRNITSYRILLDNSTLQHAYLAILGEGMEFVLFQDSKPDSMIVSYT